MALVVGGILWLRLHAFVALLVGALAVAVLTAPTAVERSALARGATAEAAATLARQHPAERIAQGFGRTAGQLGIMVAMASIIGSALLASGAAERIVRALLAVVGQARAGLAFLAAGFLLGIPVFFDTVFYLLVPLAKAMRLRTGGHYLLYVLAIVAGGTMTHSLVPPTPGPLFTASALGVNLGTLIVGGSIVGAVASTAGYLFARAADRRFSIPLRESPDTMVTLETLTARPLSALPPLWLSLAPVLLPIVLITANAAMASRGSTDAPSWPAAAVAWAGDRNMALVIAAAVAGLLLWRHVERTASRTAVREALESAGVIVLITAAGGAFGSALQQTGLGATLEALTVAYQLPVLLLAWGLTMVVRTAQGSATVAMITSAGVLGPLAAAGSLGFHPVYLALAIGCGSKPVWWMNDSGFWVITRMSGLTEPEALRVLTPMSVIMGTFGLAATLVGAWLLPMQ